MEAVLNATTTTTSPISRRTVGKIAKLQGVVVRGVTAALRSSGGGSKTSVTGNNNNNNTSATKRSVLRVVRPSSTTAKSLIKTSWSSSSSSTTSRTTTAIPTVTEWAMEESNWTAGWSITTSNSTTTFLAGNHNETSSSSNGTDGSGMPGMLEARDYWALLLFLFPLLTVFGNVLVILSIYRERTLQTATNYFIISLAIADLLVATLVMPFAVYAMVNVEWGLPAVVCDFYIAMDVTCSTSSIFNLVAISIDRYIAVTQPIKYARHKNHKRVWLTIGLVWAISAAIGSPIVLGLNHTPSRDPTLCMFYNTDFVIYSSLSSFYIPCIIMVFLYYQIFKAIRERAKKANRKHANSHLMDNLAHTKRLAETALGGSPAGGIPPAGSSSSTTTGQQPANKAGATASSAVSALVTVSGVTSSAGPPGASQMAKAGLMRGKGVDDDKLTDQGSGSQDEEEDDEREEDDEVNNAGHPSAVAAGSKSKAAQYILSAQLQNDAISKIVLPTVLCNGDSNGNQPTPPSSDDVASLLPSLPGRRGNNKAGTTDSSTGGQLTNADSGTPPSGSIAGIQPSSMGPPSTGSAGGGGGKESKQQGSRFTIYKVNKASRKKREKSSAKKERKATKTLAIVLAVFLICWVPFFTCNIMDAICTKLAMECQPGVTAFMLTSWLGYVNSFINPVIYTIFNMEFRKAFKKILVCER